MFPILAMIGEVKVHSYGFFIAIGYLAGMVLVLKTAKSLGRDTIHFMDLSFLSIVNGILGARAFFVFTNLDYFQRFPKEIFNFWNGGLVFYGGFIFAFVMNCAYIRWKKIPFAETMDIGAPSLALSHGIGRIGCLGAGCCHGKESALPWAVKLNSDLVEPSLRNLPVHPTQIYEAMGLFALSAVLYLMVIRKQLSSGIVSLFYIFGYAALRFLVELFRGDSLRGHFLFPWLSVSQAIAIPLFCVSGILLARRLRSNH